MCTPLRRDSPRRQPTLTPEEPVLCTLSPAVEAPAHGVATGPGKEFLRAGALVLASHLEASAAQGPAHREGAPVMSPSCANGAPLPGPPRRRTDPVGRSPVADDTTKVTAPERARRARYADGSAMRSSLARPASVVLATGVRPRERLLRRERLAVESLRLPGAVALQEEGHVRAGAGELGQKLARVARRQITPEGEGLAHRGLGVGAAADAL